VLAEIATVLAPLFLCAGIGFAWARSGRIFDAANMGDLIAIVGLALLRRVSAGGPTAARAA